MGLRPTANKGEACFFVTTSFKDRQAIGNVPGFYDEMACSLNFCLDKYHAQLPGYVFIPTHLHLLIIINGEMLSSFMRDFKKYLAQKPAKDFGLPATGLWMSRYDKVVIYSDDIFRTKLNYIHNNPVKARLINDASDWQWSSAKDYCGETGGPVKVWKGWL